MEKQISVAKHENSILPGFRKKISQAESTEDVKKFFVYTIQELLVNVFEDNQYQDCDAIALSSDGKPHYTINKTMMPTPAFFSVWKNSDLPRVISRLAETAMNRHRHLQKKPEKTTTKIRN